ncbi:hypothetical protein HBE96_05070 [Clostridium sp. P21]|uniref:Uncharacterized protein n=1 Tax=Clostridium muellerianum TaxID=2716538 RepID=A0A7Y0HMD5_9CLOT|nr:hypothetical protein [Clostridium muellerianum]NMM62070.1 hypothetical protein [Clostridium muellerianum]
MLKIQLDFLFGDRLGNKGIWYFHDKNTNKFYKKIIKANEGDVTETIEEVPEELVENYMYQKKISY